MTEMPPLSTLLLLGQIHADLREEKIKEGMRMLGRSREELTSMLAMTDAELNTFLMDEQEAKYSPRKQKTTKKLCVVCNKQNNTSTDYCSRGCMRSS